jgi:hypothetical protein
LGEGVERWAGQEGSNERGAGEGAWSGWAGWDFQVSRRGREGFAGRVDSLPDGARSWEGGSPSPPGLPLPTSRSTAAEGLDSLPVTSHETLPFRPPREGLLRGLWDSPPRESPSARQGSHQRESGGASPAPLPPSCAIWVEGVAGTLDSPSPPSREGVPGTLHSRAKRVPFRANPALPRPLAWKSRPPPLPLAHCCLPALPWPVQPCPPPSTFIALHPPQPLWPLLAASAPSLVAVSVSFLTSIFDQVCPCLQGLLYH